MLGLILVSDWRKIEHKINRVCDAKPTNQEIAVEISAKKIMNALKQRDRGLEQTRKT